MDGVSVLYVTSTQPQRLAQPNLDSGNAEGLASRTMTPMGFAIAVCVFLNHSVFCNFFVFKSNICLGLFSDLGSALYVETAVYYYERCLWGVAVSIPPIKANFDVICVHFLKPINNAHGVAFD